MRPPIGWAPAAVLALGAVLATAGVKAQRTVALRVPLAEAVPAEIGGSRGRDVVLSEGEVRVAGVTTYLARTYGNADSTGDAAFSLYIGYYAQQTQGQSVHSPKNCLPGAGWQPLTSQPETVAIGGGSVTVNRYLLQNGRQRALVLYWYQGRGRVAWNEYRVKWDLLRDAAVRRRSDEALVRIVVPVRGSEAAALQTARTVAATIVPAVASALPS